MDAPAFKRILDCFNSGGDVQAWKDLFDQLTDVEIEEIIRPINKSLILQPKRLSQVEMTFNQLESKRLLDPVMTSLGRINAVSDFILASIRLLGEMEKHSPGIFSLVIQGLNENGMTLNGMSRFFKTPALQSMAMTMRAHPNPPDVTQAWVDIFRTRMGIGHVVGQGLMDGRFFGLIDEVFGSDPEQILKQTSKTRAFFNYMFDHDGAYFNDLLRFTETLQSGLYCLDHTRFIEKPVLYGMVEVAEEPDLTRARRLLLRDNRLLFSFSRGMCEFPAGFVSGYPKISEMAGTLHGPAMHEWLRAYHRNGLLEFVTEILADPARSSRITPIFMDVVKRDLLADAFLVATALPQSTRDSLAYWASLFSYPTIDWNDLFEKLDPEIFRDFLQKMEATFSANELVENRILEDWINGFAVNEVDPLSRFGREYLLELQNNQKLQGIFFKLASSPRMKPAQELLAHMAQVGGLRELSRSILTLFHRFVSQNGKEVDVLPFPDTAAEPRRHEWKKSDLQPYLGEPGDEDWEKKWASCRKLDFSPDASFQVSEDWLNCVGTLETQTGLNSILNELKQLQSPDGKSFFDILYPYLGKDVFHGSDWNLFLSGWLNGQASTTQAFIERLREFIGGPDQWGMKLVDHVSEWAKHVHFKRWVEPFEKFLARWLQDEKMGGRIAWLEGVLEQKPVAASVAPVEFPPDHELANLLITTECTKPQEIQGRIAALKNDFDEVIQLDELEKPGHTGFGPKKTYRLEERTQRLDDLLSKMPLAELASTFYRVTHRYHDPGQFQGRSFFELVERNARTVIPITYLYTKTRKPRVILASGLDLVELVVLNADFKMFPLGHIGNRFMGDLAESWGDEPRENWPPEIQKKYRGRKKPPRIVDTLDNINFLLTWGVKLIGYPAIPDCRGKEPVTWPDWIFDDEIKRRLYNLKRVFPYLKELHDAGKLDDLRALRDLTWEFNNSNREKNQITRLTELSALGFLRQLSRAMVDQNIGARDLEDSFTGAVGMLAASEENTQFLLARTMRIKSDALDLMLPDQSASSGDQAGLRTLGRLAFAFVHRAKWESQAGSWIRSGMMDWEELDPGYHHFPQMKDLLFAGDSVSAMKKILLRYDEAEQIGFKALAEELLSDPQVLSSAIGWAGVLGPQYSEIEPIAQELKKLLNGFKISRFWEFSPVFRRQLARQVLDGDIRRLAGMIAKEPEEFKRLLEVTLNSLDQKDFETLTRRLDFYIHHHP